MTNQEAFDKVNEHLAKQRAKSVRSGTCALRGEGGAKCAIGCLLPDEIYQRSFEDKSIRIHQMDGTPAYREHFKGVSAGLLMDLEYVHDFAVVVDWQKEMAKLAKKHELRFDARCWK